MSESSASEETAKAANSRDHVMAACLAESLPQELIILIVSHIRSRKDLHSCSTVCRSWSFPVQSRLFSDIVIKCRTGDVRVQRWMKRFQSSLHICRAVTQISLYVNLDKSVRELLEELPNG
ncbi:hypothetical protein K435DRAFT_879985 [Dendrothele bispora CBS 962.96]|uniref:F-box domain-containing protein n=1 Tax=Dendrothele bispora (strain CBS 962.96) TaxID=1314807 RepID=A0A4S8KK82_DENBC|nr:hypothetical protein K435DRAFT_879985 [Dendrothele bispora CBS 962.96]